jgi:hypothetical protein
MHKAEAASLSAGDKAHTSAPLDGILVFLAGLCPLLALILSAWFSRSGFDFSDEGYYLASIASPYSYVSSLSFFGQMYHPLFVGMNESVFALRLFNLLSTFALGKV